MNDSIVSEKSSLSPQVQSGDPSFDWQIYVQLYRDLSIFKTEKSAYTHWNKHGQKESRVASLAGIYEKFGIEPSTFPVDFDWQEYLKFNSDLKDRVLNKWQAILHYCQVGMKEGRQFKPEQVQQRSDTDSVEIRLDQEKNSDKYDFCWALESHGQSSTEKGLPNQSIQKQFNRYEEIRHNFQKTKQDPVFSIVMPIYDRTQLLRESLASLLNQSYSNFELLLILDGSPRETRDVVKEFRERDSRVRVFSYEDSSGNACRGRNKGIIEARGEYIALSDSDDISTRDRLEVSLKAFHENRCEAVVGKARYVIMEGRKQSPVKMLSENEVTPLIYPILKRVNPIVTSTISIRRDVLLKHGGFRREMTYREDHELWLRLAHRGCKLVFVDHLFGLYRLHADNNELKFKNNDAHWAKTMHMHYKRPFTDWNI